MSYIVQVDENITKRSYEKIINYFDDICAGSVDEEAHFKDELVRTYVHTYVLTVRRYIKGYKPQSLKQSLPYPWEHKETVCIFP